MKYVIYHSAARLFLARDHFSGGMYTNKLQYAKVYDTYEDAYRDALHTETVLSLEEAVRLDS